MISRLVRSALLLTLLWGALAAPGVKADEADVVWRATGGPVAFVTHIAADPTTPDFLFVFVSQGVYRNPDRTQAAVGQLAQAWSPYFSTDGGNQWQPASNDLAHVEPTILTITEGTHNNTIWVGTTEQGLWRSENGGRTWRPAIVKGLANESVIALTVDARNRLHLVTSDNTRYPSTHLYTSDDNGYNWSHRLLQVYTGDPATTVRGLVADPFAANRLYATTIGGVLVTENAGFTWEQSPLPIPESARSQNETVLAIDPTQRGRLYLVVRTVDTEGDEQILFFRSLDSAQSWETLPATFTMPAGSHVQAGLRPLQLRLDPLARSQLFLATNNGLWLSTDGGMTWRAAGNGLNGVSVADVFSHPQQRGRWIAIGAGGIWRTANAGTRWSEISDGLPAASHLHGVLSLATRPATLLALNGGVMPVTSGHQPLWRSTNGGASWMPAMLGLEDINLLHLIAHPSDPATAFGLAINGIARTEDSGRSWRYTPLPTTPRNLVIDPERDWMFLATSNGVWRSLDRGVTWQSTSLSDPAEAVAITAEGDLIAVTTTEERLPIWRSLNSGETWTQIGESPTGVIDHLITHPTRNDAFILTVQWGGLYLSNDGGQSWFRRDRGIPPGVRWRGSDPVTPDGPNILDLLIDPANADIWWASRDGGGIYVSRNSGLTWTDVSADLGDNLVHTLARANDDIVAGTSNLGLLQGTIEVSSPTPPAEVDARIEILWPHDFMPVEEAQMANIGLRLYRSRMQEPPPCAWTPSVELWIAQEADPLRRIGLAEQRTVEGHPFPFWDYNDVDVTWANDPDHKLIFLAQVTPSLAESHSSVWIHAADARTYLPVPPTPTGLTDATPTAIDALIRVVWPHDHTGNYTAPEQANLVNISAVLMAKDTQLALAPEHLPDRVWLVGALDNQVGRRLAVGEPRTVQTDDLTYTTYEFNNLDVSLARDPNHHWSFWLEVPNHDYASNVWVHGIDSRTRAPELLEPITGCQP